MLRKCTASKCVKYCVLLALIPFLFLCQVDEDVALDQAVKFCQIQLATSAQRQVKHHSSFMTGKL